METLRIVNAVYTMQSSFPFDVAWLHFNLMETKLYPARPHMLKWKLTANGKTVLIFPNNKIQIIGKVTKEEAESMWKTIVEELRQALDEPMLTITSPKLSTMTVTARLSFKPNLRAIQCNDKVSYEPEIFPAALLSHWAPLKVTLFPSGHINFTGVKNIDDVIPILKSLDSMYHPSTL